MSRLRAFWGAILLRILAEKLKNIDIIFDSLDITFKTKFSQTLMLKLMKTLFFKLLCMTPDFLKSLHYRQDFTRQFARFYANRDIAIVHNTL